MQLKWLLWFQVQRSQSASGRWPPDIIVSPTFLGIFPFLLCSVFECFCLPFSCEQFWMFYNVFLLFLFCWLMMHDWSCFCRDSISGLLVWNWWEGSGHFCCRIIIAVLTVLERVGDILVSWYVPFTWQQISTALCSYCWWLVAFYNVLRTHAG